MRVAGVADTVTLNVTQADIDRAEEMRELNWSDRPDRERNYTNFCPLAQAMRREWELPDVNVTHQQFVARNGGHRLVGSLTKAMTRFAQEFDLGRPVPPKRFRVRFREYED